MSSALTLNQRYNAILNWFADNRPAVQSELHFKNGYELIVSVVLSAQCTDKRVNMVTPALFKRFPDPESLAGAAFDDLLSISDFQSVIPSDIDSLMSLPGVGRKTANVVASILYDKPVIAVDTHVLRVSNRLGLSHGKTPEKVEADLESHIPVEQRAISHHWLILHGRYTCTARNPRCGECPLTQWCESYPELSRQQK